MSKVTQALKIIRLEAENARLVAENARLTRERDAAYAAADKFAKLLHDDTDEELEELPELFGGHVGQYVDVDGEAVHVLGDPSLSQAAKDALATVVRAVRDMYSPKSGVERVCDGITRSCGIN